MGINKMSEKNDVVNVLIIDYSHNWSTTLKKNIKTKSGKLINLEQTEWKHLHVEAGFDDVKVLIHPSEQPFPFSNQDQLRELNKIDLMLIRNFPKALHQTDFRNTIIGLLFGNVKSINSLESVLLGMDRALMYNELKKISLKLGKEKFPLIEMKFHSNLNAGTGKQLYSHSFPCVVKVSSTHAGFGKTRVQSKAEFDDLMSILAL